MPTKSAMDKVNALISNEVSARARPTAPLPISIMKQTAEVLGMTDEEAQAYFFPPSAGGKAKAKAKKPAKPKEKKAKTQFDKIIAGEAELPYDPRRDEPTPKKPKEPDMIMILYKDKRGRVRKGVAEVGSKEARESKKIEAEQTRQVKKLKQKAKAKKPAQKAKAKKPAKPKPATKRKAAPTS